MIFRFFYVVHGHFTFILGQFFIYLTCQSKTNICVHKTASRARQQSGPRRSWARYMAEQERCPRSGAQNCIVLKHHEISDSAVTLHYCQLSARYRPNVAHESASIHSLFVPLKTPKIWKLLCESYNRSARYRRCDMMFLFHRMDFSVFKAYLRLYSIYKYDSCGFLYHSVNWQTHNKYQHCTRRPTQREILYL